MDSGYDDKGLRLREGSQGNGDTDDHEETSPTTTAGGIGQQFCHTHVGNQ